MNHAPSLKRLESAFPDKGAELRKLLKGEVKTSAYGDVRTLTAVCLNKPEYGYRLMTAINQIIEGYGIETLEKNGEPFADYINLGYTYTTTIIRKLDTGTIIIGCLGDFVESNRL